MEMKCIRKYRTHIRLGTLSASVFSTLFRGVSAMLFVYLCSAPHCVLAAGAADEGTLRVVKYGEHVFLRSAFSPQHDLVVRVAKGTNRQINFVSTLLVNASAGMSMQELTVGTTIHGNGDDSTPWNINSTYIGANHGCSDARVVTIPEHGLTTADLGTLWTDEAGAQFCLLKIADKDRGWFLPPSTSQNAIWHFNRKYTGSTLKNQAGRTLTHTKISMVQLTPACRIKTQQYLIDGKTPLVEGEPSACDFFDIVEEYDIINPASIVQDMIDHPGEQRSFTAAHLAGVIRNHITYRFHPNGAHVIHTKSTALQEFRIGYMGFIQSGKLYTGKFDTHEYYIPKTLPFTQDDTAYDFRAIQDYRARPKSPLRFRTASKNIEFPENLPERFFQFLGRKDGDKTVREVGYGLGYSLINGMTKPAIRAGGAGSSLMLYSSAKTYPTAIDSKAARTIPAGTKFDCIAYRQYFHPAAQPNATCFLWHKEGTDTVVYADYHKAVDRDVLKLPAELVGKKITIVEKTPSLTLHTHESVPENGMIVSVSNDYGYMVIRVH